MNQKEDKYYYTKYTSSARQNPMVSRWNPYYSIDIDEMVDYSQYLSFLYDKLKTGDSEKPTSTKYSTVKPIIKQVFLSHYNLAIKNICETMVDDGDFFLTKKNNSWFQIAYYSRNEKQKQKIEIDFRDGLEDIWLMVKSYPNHKGRPAYRKVGLAITQERFKQFLNCTMQFLYDSDSYTIFFDDYLRKFYQLIEGDSRIEGFVISAEKSFEKILNQLTQRKDNLEKRLIENDADSTIDRAKFRGELEGINFAIKTISINGN